VIMVISNGQDKSRKFTSVNGSVVFIRNNR